MPIYEYNCDQCGHQFEQWQSFQDDPVQVCPNCAQRAVRKVFSSAGIIFKGSGWYITDSRKSNSASGDKPAGESKSDAASSTPEAKSDKPADKK